jgi:hypothetical protein
VEEPQLRDHEGGSQERGGGDPEGRCDQWDERHEPDSVLRRHEPSEDEERCHRRRRRGDESLPSTISAGEEPEDEHDRGHLDDAGDDRDRIGGRTG